MPFGINYLPYFCIDRSFATNVFLVNLSSSVASSVANYLVPLICNRSLLFSIGCKNCAGVAPDVFGIEEDFGRARVYSQSGRPELVQQAIDSWYVLSLSLCCMSWYSGFFRWSRRYILYLAGRKSNYSLLGFSLQGSCKLFYNKITNDKPCASFSSS